MRLFKADYRIGSNLVLSAAYDQSDAVPIKDLWDSLAEVPMSATKGNHPITPDPADPLKAVLSGDIEVSIVHAGDPLSSAKVKQITLKRDSDTSDLWYPDTATLKALTDAATY